MSVDNPSRCSRRSTRKSREIVSGGRVGKAMSGSGPVGARSAAFALAARCGGGLSRIVPNRAKRLGYSVLFVPFTNGKPSGPPEDFLTGFLLGEDRKEVWGRPVGLLQLADGSLLLSEDGNNKIWRISYKG